MTDEAETTASCAMINRHGEVVTWHARGDGVCYASDTPPSLDWIGVAVAVGLIMIVILLGLRSIRWIGSKLWIRPQSQPVSAQLHGAEKHRHLADLLNHDPKTVAGVFASICALTLGYPDRAMRLKR